MALVYRKGYAQKPEISLWYGTRRPAAAIINKSFFEQPVAADALYIGAAGAAVVNLGTRLPAVLYLGSAKTSLF